MHAVPCSGLRQVDEQFALPNLLVQRDLRGREDLSGFEYYYCWSTINSLNQCKGRFAGSQTVWPDMPGMLSFHDRIRMALCLAGVQMRRRLQLFC